MNHTMSSREFTRDVAAAKQAAEDGPVIITDRGEPAHVLLTIEAYRRLTGLQTGRSLLEAMEALPGTPGVDLDLPARSRSRNRRIPDFGDDA